MPVFSLAVAVPTLACSALSLAADSLFLIAYRVFPPERHFRQALIVNLLVADWLNSLNNTVSGVYAVARKGNVPPGPACTANGYVGQFTVQSVDFSILVISVAVLFTVHYPHLVEQPQKWQVALACAIPWLPPLVTANIALGLRAYKPVNGNWCWIEPNFALRYSLAHGWRIAIFLVTIGIYTYVYLYLRRMYPDLGTNSRALDSGKRRPASTDATDAKTLIEMPRDSRRLAIVRSSITNKYETIEKSLTMTLPLPPDLTTGDDDERLNITAGVTRLHSIENVLRTPVSYTSLQHSEALRAEQAVRRTIREMLLLNGYPILFVILWIPGIANRVLEVLGKKVEWVAILQASTQLVGFANAVTYAWNEQLTWRVKRWWNERRR